MLLLHREEKEEAESFPKSEETEEKEDSTVSGGKKGQNETTFSLASPRSCVNFPPPFSPRGLCFVTKREETETTNQRQGRASTEDRERLSFLEMAHNDCTNNTGSG